MLWLQQYCSVHSNMEEELSENRASVYTSLSDLDRYAAFTDRNTRPS